MNTLNTKQNAMNIRRAKSQLTSKVGQEPVVEVDPGSKMMLVNRVVKMKDKREAAVGGVVALSGIGFGIYNHVTYAEKNKNYLDKGQVVYKSDYAIEIGLPIFVVLVGSYLIKLGLSLHPVEVKVNMTVDAFKKEMEAEKEAKKQAELSAAK